MSDFPEPLSPTMQSVSPGDKSIVRFSTAKSRSDPSGSAMSRFDILRRVLVNFVLLNGDSKHRSGLHQQD